jgi:tetratricopeptide (TPR) repeat protein
MKRPYYNSPGLPISWDEEDYISGKNEIVWVENRLNAPLEVKKAFQFLHSNDPRTKRDGEGYIPSDQLFVFSPDSQKIFFKKAKRFTRSEMMVMDMLSTNDWKRPIYFAVTIGNDYHLGLDPYLELTGMAYRITPERSKDGRPRVNTEVMYDNMLNKFKYGNMHVPGIYIDENTMRMCRTHRMMFLDLIEALYQEGKYDKCLEVLDFAEQVLPGYNISYDYTSASMAVYYYQLGEMDKANAIMAKVADTSAEYLAWGASLAKEQRASSQSTLGHQMAIFGYVLQNFERFEQKELFNHYYDIYVQYASQR